MLVVLIRDYLNFRSFIFGTAPKEGNPMFPDGVVYAGVGDEKPTYFRGESGANDSSVLLFIYGITALMSYICRMIPLGDNLLESQYLVLRYIGEY
jgi:indoleamine 2,3-dioxygenase